MTNTNAKKENDFNTKNKVKIFIFALLAVVVSIICLGILCVAFLTLAHVVQYGLEESHRGHIDEFLKQVFDNPLRAFSAYFEWMQVFYLALIYNSLSFSVFIPLLAPLSFAAVTLFAFFKSSYSLPVWYKFSNHFAEHEDIEKMGLLEGVFLNLGKFEDHILRLKNFFSVLCIGQIGSGKTSSVAIPSILDSDNSCIFAVDDNGTLAKFTSGYRAQLGKVFYFNWDLQDVAGKTETWPRWNPLSPLDVPSKGKQRDAYISKLARVLLENYDKDNKESYWEHLSTITMEGLLHFFVSKMEQAYANDYFLSEILEKKRLSAEDKDIMLSYYALMPKKYSSEAIKNLEQGKMTIDNYLPIGSWQGIAKGWRGKELSLPMFADNIVQRYFMEMQNDSDQNNDGWKFMLENFLAEAQFFGYHHRSIQILQHLSYLSKKQRSIVAGIILKPLSIFRNASIRERTSVSDFSLSDSRGIKNAQTGEWDVVSVYCSVGSRGAQFMTRMMMEMLISENMSGNPSGPFPMLFVLDNLERIPKINYLASGLTYGLHRKMSFLLLTSDLQALQKNYGMDDLENIVSNASYKLVIAESNQKLSEHFSELGLYGTKSVQMQPPETSKFVKSKFGLADSSYYNKIAKDLLSRHRSEMVKKGYLLLLSPTYYHLPVKAKAMFFLKHDYLREKATMDTAYFLDAELEKKRNVQDIEVPSLLSVIKETGISVDSEEDIDKCLDDEYKDVIGQLQNFRDAKTVLADDISCKWKSKQEPKAEKEVQAEKLAAVHETDEWWMSEDSFSSEKNESANPFK